MGVLLHNIGPKPDLEAAKGNYNTREEVRACHKALTFDGVYLNVWENRDLLVGRMTPPLLFVMGDYVGKDNSFDKPMPFEQYCDWWHLVDLVTNYHCKLGWHTWSHRKLTDLSDEEVLREVTPPFPMQFFAYPYGDVDQRVEDIVRSVGCYISAFSVCQGNGSPFQMNRSYL